MKIADGQLTNPTFSRPPSAFDLDSPLMVPTLDGGSPELLFYVT